LTDKPILELSGRDGNAFAIIAEARRVARKAGWSKEKIEGFTQEAEMGDYDHVLMTCEEYFEVV